MRKGNRRDAKFLIFQSLYIIAIAILFFKGTDLSLNYVKEIKPGQIPADSNKVLKDGQIAADTAEVKRILLNDSIYLRADTSDILISYDDYLELNRKANQKQKFIKETDDKRKEKTGEKTKVEGE